MEGLGFLLDLMDVASLLFDASAWLLRKLMKRESEPVDQCSVSAGYGYETDESDAYAAGFRDPLIFGRFSSGDLILRASLPSNREASRLRRRRIARRRRWRASGH